MMLRYKRMESCETSTAVAGLLAAGPCRNSSPPHGLFFFDREWNYMCSRGQISSRLEEITGITPSILQRVHIFPPGHAAHIRIAKVWCRGCRDGDDVETQLAEEPISRKMRWAANRSTTRPEDTSYCLLGLFGINMPLLYGEGENAFGRLQEEILKKSPDQSILTWTEHSGENFHKPYLAKMPSEFQFAVRRPEKTLIERGDIIATPRGLEIDVLLGPCTIRNKQGSGVTLGREQFMAILSCAIAADPLPRVAIFVEPLNPEAPDTAYTRVHNYLLIELHPAVEPLILARHQLGFEEFKDVTVDYDPRKLSPSRILLAAIRPMRDRFKQRPGVYIVAPGIEKVKINVIQWTPTDNAMISYQQPISRGGGVGHLSVGGAWYVGNGDSGFFVLWGVTVFPDDRDFVTWAETRESFLQGSHSETSCSSSLDWYTFGKALQQYMRIHKGFLSPYISEPGFKVRVNVTTIEFLGRKTHRVILDIDGWEGRPVSIVDCMQLVAHDWT
ncbi:hypothetical protein NW759_013408 [Fusarium solani]|nr:hypothetical protein NW759_013408 [Fusarium solani]